MMVRKLALGIMAAVVALGVGACKPEAASLDGTWECCRTETGDMPDAKAKWEPVKVPSMMSQSGDCPYLWFRRSFDAPQEFKGRRVFLRFGGVRFVSEVHLNGKKVGGHYGGWEPFEIDVTDTCRLGGSNDLLVRVQDVTGVIDQKMEYRKLGRGERFISEANDAVMAPVGSRFMSLDIWQPVSLIARNDVYVENVFIQTSVRKNEIRANITLRNLTDRERIVRLASAVKETGMVLDDTDAIIPAKETATLTFQQPWKNPRLWGPEDPYLYHLITKINDHGKELDLVSTRFGFREFWTDGIYMVLNGTRMNFLATAGHPRGELDNGLSKAAAIDFYRRIREAGCVAMRLHANIWPEWWYEAADEVGMPIIMESALFCYSKNYALSKPKFWENYHTHLQAVIRDKWNHPSIVMYSLENEILHCGGEEAVKGTIHRLAEAGRFVKKLDPTRPIMYDADHDPEGVADVVNLHYPLNFNKQNLWPDVGYWLETGMEIAAWPRGFWTWDRKKPLYFGEFLHMQHFTEPDPYSTLIGDDAYQDFGLAMGKAKGIAWTMQIEAYRADELSGMCPWTLTETGDFPSDSNPRYLTVKRTYQKNAAFIREYDTRFYENEKVPRTVYVYNDTLHPASLTFAWELKMGEAVVDQGERRLDAQPAERFKLDIALQMPAAKERTPLTLTLKTLNGKTLAFEESRTYWVFPRRKPALPPGKRIAVFEGQSKVLGDWLREAGAEPMAVADPANLPKADILVIGPHALDAMKPPAGVPVVGGESGARQAVHSFVRQGGVVVALEQDSYDCGLLPASLIDRGCTIAFQRAREEDLFKGVVEDDFKFWRGDHIVARKTLAKPQVGRFRALVDSGGPAGLVYLPLCEIMAGEGKYILSQMAVGEKLGKEPMAQAMLENMLRYAACAPAPVGKLAVVQDKLRIRESLAEMDVIFSDISGKLDKSDLGGLSVLIAEANCPEVERNQAKIRQFVEGGGKAVLHGGTREGLARIQGLFPEPIVGQANNSVPVTIAEWDPVINGLTNQELHWYGSRKGLNWRVNTPLSPDVCRYVVGGGMPEPGKCRTIEAESMRVIDGAPRMSEGDVYMGSSASITGPIHFPETGEYSIAVRGKGTPLGGVYPQIRITIDKKRVGSVTTDGKDWGEYSLSAHVAKGDREVTLSFVNDAWDPEKGEDRNVWLDKVIYGPTPALKSKRLLSPAALVKVPTGKGFYLIDQVQWTGQAGGSEKAGRYLSNLLTNLGCAFGDSAGAIVIPGKALQAEEKLKLWKAQDDGLRMGSNGTVFTKVKFGATRKYEFAMKASGTEAAGEFPNIEVSIDGKKIGSLKLSRPEWQILRLQADVAEGEHTIGLSFTNDLYNPPEDRNLNIGHLQIR
ncbi:MAG: carbohydrate-binding domain-containing protein [Planctomycetota bacterium]